LANVKILYIDHWLHHDVRHVGFSYGCVVAALALATWLTGENGQRDSARLAHLLFRHARRIIAASTTPPISKNLTDAVSE
jgi:hypothetical protein